jgi:hypothetical protein
VFDCTRRIYASNISDCHEDPFNKTWNEAASVAWWSSALTPSQEGTRSIPNPGNPFLTLGIDASPLFWDLAGRFCLILNMARLVAKNWKPCKNWWRDNQNPIHKKTHGITNIVRNYLGPVKRSIFLDHGLAGSAISAQTPVNQRHHRKLWACCGSSAHPTEEPIASAISH